MSIEIMYSDEEYNNQLLALMIQYFNFYQTKPPAEDKIIQLIKRLQNEEINDVQFIAKYNNTVCGFVTLYELYSTLKAEKILLMNDLFVISKYRQMGIGKALFNKALQYTRENNYPKMEWMTEPTNIQARHFYDRLGGQSSEWIYYSINSKN